MLVTDDYLKLDPWEALIRIINDRYHLELDTKTTTMVSFEVGTGTRTSIRLSRKRSDSPRNLLPEFTERTFHYSRIDLESYFGSEPIVVSDIALPTSTSTLIKQLSTASGVVFSHNDFINDFIETDEELEGYVLQAHPKSLRWVGSLRFTNRTEPKSLDLVTNPVLKEALTLHDAEVEKIIGRHLLVNRDFTPYRSLLELLQIGGYELPPERLLTILNDLGEEQGSSWVCEDGLKPWNIASRVTDGLAMYEVIYNGVVLDRWTPRRDIRSVLVLRIHPDYCTNLSGYLLLHYD